MSNGPNTGIFTDGSCDVNPGPGGWGFVQVENGQILNQDSGWEAETTNNRMELTALIKACESLSREARNVVYCDSKICVNTINQWAGDWERRGWRRKKGSIANLDLVKHLWALVQERPNLRFQWIQAHNGATWNEYADSLANEARPGIQHPNTPGPPKERPEEPSIEQLVADDMEWIRKATRVESAGKEGDTSNRWWVITTPYLDLGNDCIQIYVRIEDQGFVLSDDGETLTDLEMRGIGMRPERKEALRQILKTNGVELEGDTLKTRGDASVFSHRKIALIQGILQVIHATRFPEENP